MTNTWLSVLIPTYNGETYISHTLDSILHQNDSSIECVIVDDGSTDNTLSLIETYKTRLPIRLICRERIGNWVANTNFALSYAKGDYVCFLHQDDIWLNNRLRIMKDIIDQYPESGLFLHATNFIDRKGNHLGVWRCPLQPIPETITPKIMTGKLLIQNFIPILAPIFKRELALKVGGLNETLWYTADWDLWLKISAICETVYYPHPLSGYRVQPASQTFVRSSFLEDFREQLETVFYSNLSLWNTTESMRKKISKIGGFSLHVNTALAGVFHGKKVNLASLLLAYILLGPFGWLSYPKNSRIWERTYARVKARLLNRL